MVNAAARRTAPEIRRRGGLVAVALVALLAQLWFPLHRGAAFGPDFASHLAVQESAAQWQAGGGATSHSDDPADCPVCAAASQGRALLADAAGSRLVRVTESGGSLAPRAIEHLPATRVAGQRTRAPPA